MDANIGQVFRGGDGLACIRALSRDGYEKTAQVAIEPREFYEVRAKVGHMRVYGVAAWTFAAS